MSHSIQPVGGHTVGAGTFVGIIAAGLVINTTAVAQNVSDQLTDGDLDPFTLQDDYAVISARIGFNFDNWNSNLTVWGRNITDERYFHGTFDAPIQVGRMNSYPSEPSSFGVTFHKNFE